jgi:6,7-dimethyl-8-ribityllumazine synthase
MSEIEHIEGRLDGRGRRFTVVAARFNSRIVDLLVGGAVDCLQRHGVEPGATRVVRVPGAWEIPLALEELAAAAESASPPVDGLVALAAVVRGETPHFDYVCAHCAEGVARIGKKYRIPVGFGILTCDTSSQAEERAGGKAGNKGWEAAQAALEMADLVRRIRGGPEA